MTDSISVEISTTLYERLIAVAQRTGRSVESVLAQSIDVTFGAFEEEAMTSLPDEQLWAVVHRRLAWPLEERLTVLTARGKTQSLSSSEQTELDALLDEADRLMVLRSKAVALLKQRGHDVTAYLGG